MDEKTREMQERYDKLERMVAIVQRAIDRMEIDKLDSHELRAYTTDIRTVQQEIKRNMCSAG